MRLADGGQHGLLLLREVFAQGFGVDLATLCTRSKLDGLEGRNGLGDVLELAYIAGPAVVAQRYDGVVGECDLAHAVFLREVRGELAEKEIDVVLAVTKCRHADLDGVEAVVQVLAELALADGVQ